MGLFENFPYTNFHRANLDWVLRTVKEVAEGFVEVKADFEQLQQYVMNYFANLDVDTEIRQIIGQMASDGTLRQIMEPYIDSLAGDVSDLRGDVEVLSARMDTFASLSVGSTTGDAELMDARIGGNGITYPSAGDAIRAQYDINHTAIYRDDDSLTDNIMNQVDWEQGNINSSGQNVAAATRIRTKGFLPTSAVFFDNNANGYPIQVRGYDAGGGYLGEWNSTQTAFVASGSGFAKINLGDIYKRVPGCRLRLVAYPGSGQPNPTPSVAATYTLTNSVLQPIESAHVRLCQYNVGKFNYGVAGGLPAATATVKTKNYKKFIGEYKPDILCFQEYVTYIDSNATIAAADVFGPVFREQSQVARESTIYADSKMYRTGDQWIQVSGDPSASALWADMHIGGRHVKVITGYLNVNSTTAQKQAAIDRLMNEIVAYADRYVILSYDFNPIDQTEADALKLYLASYGFTGANWAYFGYNETYRLNWSGYKCIDNVFVKGPIKFKSFIVPDVYADLSSDHFPVITDLILD